MGGGPLAAEDDGSIGGSFAPHSRRLRSSLPDPNAATILTASVPLSVTDQHETVTSKWWNSPQVTARVVCLCTF
ncbi:hypothetical protein Aduo_002062 [Ancylostoma duodenale]